MSRARDLSKLGNPNVIKADTANNVGFGTQTPLDPANSGNTNIVSAGIVTAAKFFGDGSGLDGVASAGLGTAVDDTKDSIGQNIYYTNQELSIYENTTVNAPATSDVAYTQYSQVTVEDGKELIVADGDTFIPDVLGIGTGLQAVAAGAGNGLFGTVYVDNIENVAGRGGPNLPLGMTVSGIATFSGNVSIGGTLTYEDVTNVDSIGVVTARSGVDINAGGLDITAGGVNVGGISTLGGNVNIAGNAQFTVASPQLEFNNGGPRLWSPSANTLTIHTGGGFGSTTNERLRIGSAGQIGLGGANYGTTGQVLTSQGASAAPQWGDAGGGQWKKLTSGTATSGDYMNVTTSLLDNSYVCYKLEYFVHISGSGNGINLQQYHDGAYKTDTNYVYNSLYSDELANSWSQNHSNSGDGIPVMYYSNGAFIQGTVQIWRPYETGFAPIWVSKASAVAPNGISGGGGTGGSIINECQGHYTSSGGVKNPTGFRLKCLSAITWANWHLYGLSA